jgi:hypothetical protein
MGSTSVAATLALGKEVSWVIRWSAKVQLRAMDSLILCFLQKEVKGLFNFNAIIVFLEDVASRLANQQADFASRYKVYRTCNGAIGIYGYASLRNHCLHLVKNISE